ncbi:MAG: cation diffusion facilitator family transporter [Clostridia bacterium]|nr:cation diffusion facilitator family transporter [Clostridia bacterium]MBR2417585.1 cation diffusion facilitator family transporter [Clostridia bacterium]
MIKDRKYVLSAGVFAFVCNLLLFLVKLYVGLASGSISIYSDGINNFFDCLSGALAFGSIIALSRIKSEEGGKIVERTQHLLSFIMSVIVAISGFYFAYNSLERFVYPTPVNYMTKYLWIIVGTTLVKLLMIFVFRFLGKKAESPVIRVMAVDGVLDFFVSGVTVLTLVLTKNGGYAYDAVCGLVIGILITVGAIKLVVSSVKAIIFD